MACFDTGQAHLTNTTPVKLFGFADPGASSVTIVAKTTAGSCYVGGSATVSSSTGLQIPNGLPVSVPIIPGRNAALYAVTDGTDVTVSWMLGA